MSRTVAGSRQNGSDTTTLDASVSDLPWQDSYSLGRADGIDAVTGGVANVALLPFTVTEVAGQSSTETYTFVESDKDYNRVVDAATGGKYNIEAIATVSSSTEYLSSVEYSATAVTLIAEYAMAYDTYDEAPQDQYRLTDQAKALIGDPAAFRARYGDYFVAGGRRGARFLAVYTCTARSEKDMTTFKEKIDVDVPEVFSVTGATGFTTAAADNDVSITCSVVMEGYENWTPPSGPWDPQTIPPLLDRFKAHLSDSHHVSVKLRHYSYLDPAYPLTIDVPSDDFESLADLYTSYWRATSRYESSDGSELIDPLYENLRNGVTAHQADLVHDADLRGTYLTQTTQLGFLVDCLEDQAAEPATGAQQSAGSRSRWSYGCTSQTGAPWPVTLRRLDYRKGGGEVGYRTHTFDYPDPGQGTGVVVGWEVVANWADGSDGYWSKESETILLGNRASVHVKGAYDRGTDWTLNVYTIDRSVLPQSAVAGVREGRRLDLGQFLRSTREWAGRRTRQFAHNCLVNGGWEGWVQVDLTAAILGQDSTVHIVREAGVYPGGGRADLLVNSNPSSLPDQILVEIKAQSLYNGDGFIDGVKDDMAKITGGLKPGLAVGDRVVLACAFAEVAPKVLDLEVNGQRPFRVLWRSPDNALCYAVYRGGRWLAPSEPVI
ncbi:hypothetical protein ACIA8O_01720 [Kitasatospora sp. NPDC051853]|uniref:hypothetical protein n=1 Tax=Kitasatospora sp. NPDC051853 TaxID=3364058 RepID=UPI0037A587ED